MKTLDAGQAETDKLLKKVERQVKKEYTQATKDMEKKLSDYLKSFEKKDKIKQKELAEGLITDKQYKDWRYGQVMIGKRWKEQLDVLTRDLENSRQIALNIVSGSLPDAYAIGHNYGTFLVEKGSKVNTSYTLYNRDTVAKLLRRSRNYCPTQRRVPKRGELLKRRKSKDGARRRLIAQLLKGSCKASL